MVFNDRDFMLLEEVECLGWGHTCVGALILNEGIKVDGDLSIFDQMLEVGISAIFTDYCFAIQG